MDFENNREEVQKYRKLINQNGIDGLYLHHPNKWVRRLIVKKIEDEDALKDFALNDPFHRVRLEAIRKISDEEFLAKIVFNEEEKYIKNLALKKIKDKSILENIALNHPSFNIRASLFDYISDDNTIWDLAKNDFYADIRKLAIEKINDNSLLYEIALNDSKKTVKRKAIIQMDDEDLLIKLRKEIEEDYSYLSPIIRERIRDIHMEMAKSSTDESVLIDLALNDPDSYVRDYAVENPHLNNQDVLEHLIFNDSNKMVRRQAVSKIKDDKVLIEVAQNDSDSWVRHSAVYNLDSSNQDIFIDIFYNDEDNDVKNVALLKIEDQNILKEQVENGDENRVYYAITNLEDEKLLMDTYKKYPYSKIQEKIIESPNLTDENFLEDIVLNEHWRLGVPALKRINDSSILANIAQKSSDQFLRKKAVKRIKDPDVLLELVYNSDDFDNVKRAGESISICFPRLPKYIKDGQRAGLFLGAAALDAVDEVPDHAAGQDLHEEYADLELQAVDRHRLALHHLPVSELGDVPDVGAGGLLEQADALGVGGCGEAGVHRSGAQCRDGHAGALEFHREGLGEGEDVRLAGIVHGHEGAGFEGGYGGHVEDPPLPPPHHAGQVEAGEMGKCQVVEFYHLLLLVPVAFDEGSVVPEARVVHEDVGHAGGEVEELLPGLRVGQVHGYRGDGNLVVRRQFVAQLLQFLPGAGRDDEVVAVGREQPAEFHSDSAGCAGYDSELSHFQDLETYGAGVGIRTLESLRTGS